MHEMGSMKKAGVRDEQDPRATASRSCESQRAVVEGVELHWSARGSGSTVVVLHGLADSEHTWRPVMAELGRRYRVLGLDLPGCGLSARPEASYSLDWQARLVDAWLDRVGVTTCDVVGHSFGGGLALWLLLYRAESIRRLALVAPGGLGRDVAIELRLAALRGLVERWGQPMMGLITGIMTAVNGRTLPRAERRYLSRVNTAPGTARAFARTVRDVIDWRGQSRHFSDRARDVRTLPAIALFWGEQDRIIPIRHGEALCSLLDHCVLKRFPGAGHFLHWERPHALAEALVEYLDELDVPRVSMRDTEHERTDDERIDEAGEGSFPASDPPPWTLGREQSPKAPLPGSARVGTDDASPRSSPKE